MADWPVLEREARTDAQGAATLDLNPATEPTAQPRSYVVEATVVGDDDQSVTSTQQVVALPPFALGVKIPRYVTKLDKLGILVERLPKSGVIQLGVHRGRESGTINLDLATPRRNSI